MDEPLVSIITPVFNSEKLLSETIESVLNQTYKNWEHLIVDDGSDDCSWVVIQSYAEKDNRIKAFRLEENCGPGVARNFAIKKAKGKFIAFLDSDDLWVENRLQDHIKFMIDGEYVFSHSSYGYIKEDGSHLNKVYQVRGSEVDYKFLLKRTEISCLTAIYDQERIGKFFMPDLRRKQDYGLWLSILKAGYKSMPYPEVLAYYRQRKGSVTSKKSKLIIQHYEFLHKHQHLNMLQSIKYTINWGLGGIFKYYLQ